MDQGRGGSVKQVALELAFEDGPYVPDRAHGVGPREKHASTAVLPPHSLLSRVWTLVPGAPLHGARGGPLR